MPESRTHIVVGTPCYGGQVTSLYTTSLMRLQLACQQAGNVDMTVNLLSGDALITRARQNIVAHFLENALATHLLFIDADIAFDPAQVFRLLKFNADVSAGVYPTKRVDWGKLAALAKAGVPHLESAALSYVLEFEDPRKIAARDGFAKVRYSGTGFMLIKREVLIRMIEHYADLRYHGEHQAQDSLKDSRWRSAIFNCFIEKESGIYLSEDYSFCRRWTDMGGEIWADIHSRLTHLGPIAFNGDASTQFTAPS